MARNGRKKGHLTVLFIFTQTIVYSLAFQSRLDLLYTVWKKFIVRTLLMISSRISGYQIINDNYYLPIIPEPTIEFT